MTLTANTPKIRQNRRQQTLGAIALGTIFLLGIVDLL
jgi:hypothetical protein